MGGICSSPAAVQAAVEGQADVVAGKAEQAIKATTTVQATAVAKPPSNSGAKPAVVAAPPKASDSGAKQPPAPPAAAAAAAAPAKGGPKQLTILHFNDVYNIEPGERDPVGGAARLQTKIKSLSGLHPLVLFSGDCFNPSLMSTITKGKQMVPILNAMGVQASCVGNHDFDYGTENLVKLARECDFPWLMANVLDKKTGEPYAQAKSTHVLDWQGVKVGLVGLVEEEWLATLGAVDPKEMKYVDFVALGRKLANELKADGCDVVVALTHMREPNDRKLCAEVPEIDLVLGGHDHHYIVEHIKPHGTLMAKSGTDFRDMTQITLDIPGGGKRVDTKWQRHVIDSKVQEDPEVAAIVKEYMELMGSKMDEVRGLTTAELDGRFKIVRTRESNLGNFITDIWRLSTHVDLVILNSGSLRSDQIHPTGEIKAKDLVAILPMIDETVVLLMTGAEVVEALENGVSQYPKLEGRFPQVSGVRFSFDPSKPPGSRIVPGSVSVNGARLLPHCRYKVATKAYLAAGKDGYDVFLKGKVLVDSETGVTMPTMLRNHFAYLDVLNQWDPHVRAGKSYFTWKSRSLSRYKSREMSLGDLLNADQDSRYTLHAARSNGVYGMAVHHPESGSYAISPRLDGRINNIAETCCQVAWSYGDSTVSIKLVGKDVDLS